MDGIPLCIIARCWYYSYKYAYNTALLESFSMRLRFPAVTISAIENGTNNHLKTGYTA
jgi:hypothetical protein